MKLIIRIMLIPWLLSQSFQLQAQIWLSTEDIFEQAEEFFNSDEYIEALPLYHLLEKKEVTNPNISYKIGACYLNIRGKKTRAIPYLWDASQSASSQYQNSMESLYAPFKALLLLGVAYRIDNQLDKAIETFEVLKDSIEDIDPEFITVLNMHINRCENARLLNAFPGEPRTDKLPEQINTDFSNFNPVLVGRDSLLYYMEERKFYDALMRVELEGEAWGTPENLTPKIKSDGDHVLVGASNGGDTLLLAFYEPMQAGELYETHRTDEGWSPIEPLNENINTVYHETHASLSHDGKTLYFTSNRDGGYGGLDIYKSELDENNEWGPAQNLGKKINTPYNEETPIINTDNEILYFSSQGHLSMGGYDVFYSLRRGDNDWRMPINMGAPVSTTDDDLFYYPLEEQVSGLMSRLEDGANAYNIFRYNSMVFANSPRFSVRGKVPDVDTTNYEEYAVAIIQKGKADTLRKVNLNPDGNYEIILPAGDFEVVVLNDKGSLSTTDIVLADEEAEIVEIPVSEAQVALVDASPDSTGQIAQPVAEVKIDTFYLKDILYAFDKFKLNDESKVYLGNVENLMKDFPALQFKIGGHTDAFGSATYNLMLSERRAQTVLEYITSQGVEKTRLTVVGYGEEKPVAINTNPDGTDNIHGRRYNRRVSLVPATEVEGLTFKQTNTIPEHLKLK